MIVNKNKLYPIAEFGYEGWNVTMTGEYRAPKAGEWYISGAIPEGYLATNDMKDNRWIAKISYQ